MTMWRRWLVLASVGLIGCGEAIADVVTAGVIDAGPLVDGAAEEPVAQEPDAGRPAPDAAIPTPPEPAPSYQEVFDQGLTRYVGTPVVQETSVTASGSGEHALDIHHFAAEGRGPRCMQGAEFFVETRQGASDTLMIFLQGGGVCLSEICAATPDPVLSLQTFDLAGAIGIGGVLDPRSEENPMRDFDVVNAPYCDGSLFAGDVDRVLPDGNPNNGAYDAALQRGLLNLTATLETAHRVFPNPPRIVLMGSSGGAYGIIAGVVMTRYFYPDTPLLVVGDSGAPIVNGIDRTFIVRALTEFDALGMIPASCKGCLDNGHATGILEWALSFDAQLTVATMTHARDHVIGEFFMHTTADQFQAAVVEESERLIQRFPGRAFRFVVPGSRHTLSMGIDGVPDVLQGPALGVAAGFGVGFVGPDVTSEELSTWSLGGMHETGIDDGGQSWSGYAWLAQLLADPAHTPNVLQLE